MTDIQRRAFIFFSFLIYSISKKITNFNKIVAVGKDIFYSFDF